MKRSGPPLSQIQEWPGCGRLVTFLFPISLKLKKKKKTEMKKNIKTARYRGFLRACLHFRRCEITTKVVMLRGSNSDFSLLACLLLALNV